VADNRWLNDFMKKILSLMALGLLVMNLTGGCNNSSDTTPPTATPGTNEVSTNAVGTNMPAH